MTSRDSKAFVVNAKQLAQADPVAFIDALAAGYEAPVCELCDDQGERLVPVGRDARLATGTPWRCRVRARPAVCWRSAL